MASMQACPDCKRMTEVVHDHAAGDMICSECGLVLEQRSIDETSEWRTFANESSGNDPVRVGGPSNPLLADGLVTVIARGSGQKGDLPSSVRGWAGKGSSADRNLTNAFTSIENMAERAGLVATIRDRAKEIYSKVEDMKSIKGRSQDAILAACLYIACKQEDKARSFKEIAAIANNPSKKDIGRATRFIQKHLEADFGVAPDLGALRTATYMPRFCSKLGLDSEIARICSEVAKNVDAVESRSSRGPTSKAAAVIYIVTQVKDKRVSAREISGVSGVAEGTIRNTFKDLKSHAAELLPTSMRTPEMQRKLESLWRDHSVAAGAGAIAAAAISTGLS